MQKLFKYILPFEPQQNLSVEQFSEQYKAWDKPSRQFQISAISCLTALLYVIFSLLDKSWASEQVQLLMLKVHLLLVVPMLLTISYLAYKKRFYNFVMTALTLFPIISISCHMYITSKLVNYSPFLAEGYLGILWIFIVSGMPFKHALFAAIMCSIILLVSAFYFIEPTDIYTMYVFWVFCSFSFGILGAFTLDKAKRSMFISQNNLHLLAITDPLTGVFNRNQLNQVLSQEIVRDLRYNKAFGLLIIDIDHFKKINDTFGHDSGDKVLQKTAQVLSNSIRKNDTLIRWGGEEFVVIALEVDQQTLVELSNKLREKIENEHYGITRKITVSIGATLFHKDDSQDTLIARADKALYQAKENGRNNTVFS